MILDLATFQPELERYFSGQEGVVLAYLFGSHARGKAHALSDVDIAVLLDDRPDDERCFDARLNIIGDLMRLLHTNEVDVAILNQVSPALRYRVLRDGVLLFCRDHDKRIAFYLRTLNEYLDFKPILERHERAILEKARKGELFSGYDPHRGALERYRRLRERLEAASEPDV